MQFWKFRSTNRGVATDDHSLPAHMRRVDAATWSHACNECSSEGIVHVAL